MTLNSSSTLVATVSINYEDFTEGFLTCGTCLYAYDQSEHAPKLLSCSHTICQSCLELIASSPTLNNSAEAGCIKCPICRQNIAIPTGGVSALPPSFLVNQLFDLINKKPREFIPKCSVHLEQELSFCETCDCVFCDTCNNTTGSSNSNESDDSLTTTGSITTTNSSAINTPPPTSQLQQQQSQITSRQKQQHINEVCIVIPFSTAIKRMSEILNYRSQQCLGKLDEAQDNVQREIEKLEANCSTAIHDIEDAFERIRKIIEEREKELLEETKKLAEYKKNVLLEQLKTIESEKSDLSTNSSVRVNNEADVKYLSKKISDLTVKNDTALALFTPRENCLICFEDENNEALESIQESVNCYGKLRTSKTYPPYCTSQLLHYSTHLRSVAIVQSVDYEGSQQMIGGDPIHAELKLVGYQEEIEGEIVIRDKRDGTYEVSFIPPVAGKYQLFIYIFNRPIKDCPLTFETSSHHNPVAVFGQSSKRSYNEQSFDQFSQPAGLIINKHNGRIYVMDSFNSRIKVLAQIDSVDCPFSFMQHIETDCLSRSCTGIALLYLEDDGRLDRENAMKTLSLSPNKPPNPNILVTDWRNHAIYELNSDGKLLRQHSHEELLEPTNIVVDSRGRIIVVDRETIFIFDSVGKLLHKLTGYKYKTATDLKQEDNSSIKKVDPSDGLENQFGKRLMTQASANLISTMPRPSANNASASVGAVGNKEAQSKTLSGAATLNSYLVDAASNDKRSSAKTNTLSSLISIRRKPKLNSGSSLQRGSKAVMSAASKIRSTFTLSHSTSLVSTASLQSMFNNSNKQQQANLQSVEHNSHRHRSPSENNLSPEEQHNSNSTACKQTKSSCGAFNSKKKSECHDENSTLPLNELDEDAMTLISVTGDIAGENKDENPIKPFGVIRGIALGPDDELIVADESHIRVLQPGDEYVFKRELSVPSRLGVHHHHYHHHSTTVAVNDGKLCSMAYDVQSKQLLALYTSFNAATPFIQIIDYQTGKAKFIIDSFDSKLIRPSCLATYGQHVIVTDLGNDCIKKYRFY